MSATIDRREITNGLLTLLADVGAVGDAIMPGGVGWQGQPNLPGSNFTPYMVLTPLVANFSTGPFPDSQADWRLPYSLQSYGVSRDQTEFFADKARKALDSLLHTTLTNGTDHYKVQLVYVMSIGAVTRNDAVDAPYFSQADVVSIWLTKEFA